MIENNQYLEELLLLAGQRNKKEAEYFLLKWIFLLESEFNCLIKQEIDENVENDTDQIENNISFLKDILAKIRNS